MARTVLATWLLFGVMVAATAHPASSRSRGDHERGRPQFVEGELLVGFAPGARPPKRKAIRQRHRLERIEGLPLPGMERTRMRRRGSPPARAKAVGDERAVRYAQPNHLWSVDAHGDGLAPPNDPAFSELWGLHNVDQTGGRHGADIHYLPAREVASGSRDLTVGVTDTGVAMNHPDLAANVWLNTGELSLPRRVDGSPCRDSDCDDDGVVSYLDYVDDPRIDPGCHVGGQVRPWSLLCAFANGDDTDRNGFVDDILGWDFRNDDNNPDDAHGHGTHVAGTVGAVVDNRIGIAGVSQPRIMPLKFLSFGGTGSSADAIKALDYALEMGAVVTNNSWGGPADDPALSEKILEAHEQGQLFVTAAGNDGRNIDEPGNEMYPASYNHPNMVTAAATTATDRLASFSNSGAKSVQLGAPGTEIYSTVPGDAEYAYESGTSMAAPHVAGAVAAVLAGYPQMTHLEARDRIVERGDAVSFLEDQTASGRRLSLVGSLDADGPPELTDLEVASNPFFLGAGNRTTVGWSQSEPAAGVVRVDDQDGRTVRTEELGSRSAGKHRWVWDGTDDASTRVNPGPYTIEVQATDAAGRTVAESATLTVGEAGGANLRARIIQAPDSVVAGERVTYDAGLRNLGPSTAGQVRSRGVLPNQVTDVSVHGGAAEECAYQAEAHAVVCEFGAVKEHGITRMEIVGVVNADTPDGTTLEFTYEAASPTPDPSHDSRRITVTTTVTN